MIRMKNRINQVAVGEDMQNPLECDVTGVWLKAKATYGKVSINGVKHPVRLLGGGVWVFTDGYTTRAEKKQREVA